MASISNQKTATENILWPTCSRSTTKNVLLRGVHMSVFFLKGDFNYMDAMVALKSELCMLLKYFSLF